MTSGIVIAVRAAVIEAGWTEGTHLENRVALRLHRFGFRPHDVRQQYRLGRYRLDFAWPDLQIALEADGWHHLAPEGAARDARRDAALRRLGWLVFRVDDVPDNELAEQLSRVSRIVRALRDLGDDRMMNLKV